MEHTEDQRQHQKQSRALQKHIYMTYYLLRYGLIGLALAFPWVLIFLGWWQGIPWQDSMSHYYFAVVPGEAPLRVFPMRVLFVGILWALGCFLILYRGLWWIENWLLNFAGFAALGVALLPMKPTKDWPAGTCKDCASWDSGTWHLVCAGILFVCITLVAVFCTNKSLEYLKERKPLLVPLFRVLYRLIGALMVVVPPLLYLTTSGQRLFLFEASGITLFSFYWILKTVELWFSEAEKMAVLGLNPKQAGEMAKMGLKPEAMSGTGLELAKVIEAHKNELAESAKLAVPPELAGPAELNQWAATHFIPVMEPSQAKKIQQIGRQLVEIVEANKNVG